MAEFALSPGARLDLAKAFGRTLHVRGVVGFSGPYPVAFARLTAPGVDALAQADGLDRAQVAVDQPLVTAGSWVRPGGVVVERSFATRLGVRVGRRIALNGRRFHVIGIAVTTGMEVNVIANIDAAGDSRFRGRPAP